MVLPRYSRRKDAARAILGAPSASASAFYGARRTPWFWRRNMATTLGVATIGQGPREDIRGLFAAATPRGTRVILRGCLDGLSEAEVGACAPTDGDDTLYTRLKGQRDTKISKAAVIERASATLAALRRDGATVLVFACTGEFPPFAGDAG